MGGMDPYDSPLRFPVVVPSDTHEAEVLQIRRWHLEASQLCLGTQKFTLSVRLEV